MVLYDSDGKKFEVEDTSVSSPTFDRRFILLSFCAESKPGTSKPNDVSI
jgi:hypothetical protein